MPIRAWLRLIAALYVASLALPAVKAWPSHEGFRGLDCLCFGVGSPAWWANPFLFVGYVALARGYARWAAWCGFIAAPLAFSFIPMLGAKSVLVGSVLWMASAVALAAAGIEQGWRAAGPIHGVPRKSGSRMEPPTC